MRFTFREREIIELLKKNPLISQDELARSLSISRSSIAVHISNLMKKGVILGKGYVFNEQVTIVVVGLSYVNISISDEGSGHIIDVDYGGLPVQAGEILAGFGVKVKVVSLVGNDEHGEILMNRMLQNSINTSHIYKHPAKRTCRRVCMSNGNRFEEGFDVNDYEKAVNNREWILYNCEWLMVDPCFQEDIIQRAINKDDEDMPYLCTYNFLDGKQEIPSYLSKYNIIVIGVREPSAINYYRRQLEYLDKEKIRHCIITDGRSGLIYTSGDTTADYPLPPNQSFDSQEGLPCLLTGIGYGLSNNYPIRQAIRIGAGFASSSESK